MSSQGNANYLIRVALDAGITNRAELAHFMGQMEVECGGFVSMNERLGYRPERLLEVFPERNGMDTLAEARAIVAGGRQNIANAIYGGAWGARNLGNTEDGDGWRFHGRGYVQLTGRANYRAAGADLGLDLVNHPELAAERRNAADIAVHYWQTRVVPNDHQLNVREATRDINGGQKHLAERGAASQRWSERFERGYLEEHGLVERPQVIEREPRESRGSPPAADPGDKGQQGRPIREADRVRDTRISVGSISDPDGHLFRNVRTAVETVEASIGKQWDDSSERLSASLYGLALEKGFRAGDELKVAFNAPTATRQAGEIVFLQRGGTELSPDPYANRAHMITQDALAESPDAILRKVADQQAEIGLKQQVAQQAEQFEQQRQGEALRVRV
jgi:putative chitinase